MRPTRRFSSKLVLTAITIGVGYKGGEIVPVLFIGATFGAAYGGFFGLAPSFAAGLGMTAVFCGVTNSPAYIHPAGVWAVRRSEPCAVIRAGHRHLVYALRLLRPVR